MSIVVRRNPDLHGPAGRRQGLDHDWRRCPGRQPRRHRGDALLHKLSRQDKIRSGLEDEDDIRQVGDRLGAHHIQPRHPVERLLQRDRDQFFHLSRGKPHGQGLDLHLRRRELGKDVHRRVPKLDDAEDHHRRCEENHQITKTQACLNNPTHLLTSRHDWSYRCIPAFFPSDPVAPSFRYPGLGAVQQGTADRHHLRTEGGPSDRNARLSSI